MTNETIDTILTRRSIRKYEEKQISDEELDTVLMAGLRAPSAMNQQTTKFVAIRDKETRDILSKMNADVMGADNDPFYGAPCVVVVLAKDGRCIFQDGSLAIGNMLNAAKSIGLGSCWINRATEMFKTDEGKAFLYKWGLDDSYVGIGNVILGYPMESPDPKSILPDRIIKID